MVAREAFPEEVTEATSEVNNTNNLSKQTFSLELICKASCKLLALRKENQDLLLENQDLNTENQRLRDIIADLILEHWKKRSVVDKAAKGGNAKNPPVSKLTTSFAIGNPNNDDISSSSSSDDSRSPGPRPNPNPSDCMPRELPGLVSITLEGGTKRYVKRLPKFLDPLI